MYWLYCVLCELCTALNPINRGINNKCLYLYYPRAHSSDTRTQHLLYKQLACSRQTP